MTTKEIYERERKLYIIKETEKTIIELKEKIAKDESIINRKLKEIKKINPNLMFN
ncbi:hypothetical protein JYT76_03615 [Olleya sp. AH-315-F22]|nr:hypothetical protein [Olleya sp. AH-315-F22]